jgi:hypothetical protein
LVEAWGKASEKLDLPLRGEIPEEEQLQLPSQIAQGTAQLQKELVGKELETPLVVV